MTKHLLLPIVQVEHYRKKLLRKALEDTEAPTPRGKEKSSRAQHEEPLSDSERYSSRSSKKEKRKKKRDRSSSGNKDNQSNQFQLARKKIFDGVVRIFSRVSLARFLIIYFSAKLLVLLKVSMTTLLSFRGDIRIRN